VKNAIITMGKKGVVWVSEETKRFYESLNVIEKDTTGAGDIFAGSFLKSFAETNNVDKSIHYAVVAASLSVEKEGVVESIPSQQHINNFL
jgi:ribokinase